MAMRPSPRAIRLAMILLPSVVALAALAATVMIALWLQEKSIRDATAERVQEVASSLAELPQVRATLAANVGAGTPADLADADDLADATSTLQPIADLVAEAAGVYYAVITDDEGVRITHPLASERGIQVSTTNESVLAGTPFLGTETGPSGRSLRAKVPVRGADADVVGMVAVGVLESDIESQRVEALAGLLPWAAGALVVATIVSSLVTAAVERRFRRLDGLAAEHAQMQRTTAALQEQAHEFHTRLHVVHGLVTAGEPHAALDYIEDVVAVSDATPGGAPGEGGGAEGGVAASALRDAAMHAIRADLLERGALAEFDFEPGADLDDDVVSILTNLSRNAGEAGASRVRCTLRRSGDRLYGAVDDDGPGVDRHVAARIFTRGLSTKADADGRGRGIGLDLVRRLVTSRDGSVEVGASTLGGARFSFELAART
ncbi:ATP-binding protein [Microbacterium sp. LjRoot45]|uniref:sensor histidine kinase n=1 Tax=Microbacterium sp. LjRoot45 TaxID=3342329 RepID=UPI003ECF47CD